LEDDAIAEILLFKDSDGDDFDSQQSMHRKQKNQ
jgi:hypothetical protein